MPNSSGIAKGIGKEQGGGVVGLGSSPNGIVYYFETKVY